MHSPIGPNNPAADMIVKRLVAVGAVLWLGAMLAACSPFAGYMADHWPHWAGGLPPDVPPRPGAPGYDEFVAHGEAAPDAAKSPDAATGATGTAATSTPPRKAKNGKVQIGRVQSVAAPASAQPEDAQREAPAEPVENPPAEDTSVVKGGLY